jgi:hypothetical protein
MPAPPGKDAGSKVWPCHIEIRGHRLAVIGARRFACNVCARPTSLIPARILTAAPDPAASRRVASRVVRGPQPPRRRASRRATFGARPPLGPV